MRPEVSLPLPPEIIGEVNHPPVNLILRHDPDWQDVPLDTPAEVREALTRGNRLVAAFHKACADEVMDPSDYVIPLPPRQVGLGRKPGEYPRQQPSAFILGCADARVPAEVLFGRGFNDLFNVRVAGNVLTLEGAGSLQFALSKFADPGDPAPPPQRMRLVMAVGHRNCGAVAAAVEKFCDDPHSAGLPEDPTDPSWWIDSLLRPIIDPVVRVAAEAHAEAFGPPASCLDPAETRGLVDLCVYLNAAWSAWRLGKSASRMNGGRFAEMVDVVYSVVDPTTYEAHPSPDYLDADPARPAFAAPPADLAGLRDLAGRLARGLCVKLRGGKPDPKANPDFFVK